MEPLDPDNQQLRIASRDEPPRPTRNPSRLQYLKSLQQEFYAHSLQHDCRHLRFSVGGQKASNRLPSRAAEDYRPLVDAVNAGRKTLLDGKWCMEMITAREDVPDWLLDLLEEPAAVAIRCLFNSPFAKEFGLPETVDQQRDVPFESVWVDILCWVGHKARHPILYEAEDRMTMTERDGGSDFSIGRNYIDVTDLKKPGLRLMRSVANGETYVKRLGCGLFRGSVYAIDWILDNYEIPRE